MLKVAVFTCGVLWSGVAAAITWDFDDGTAQGWAAKEGFLWGGPPEFRLFSGRVANGVWEVDLAARQFYPWPSVELISSTIGHDSRLFDRVKMRFRTVHSQPPPVDIKLSWTNEHNLETPGLTPEDAVGQFALWTPYPVYFSDEWKEVELVLVGEDQLVWEGLLREIRLTFYWAGDEEAEIEYVEIDWIELTGPGERAQGGLPRPPVPHLDFAGTGLLAPPVFYPIAPNLEKGTLLDVDGDGALDLFSFFAPKGGRMAGENWVIALNDGTGVFAPAWTGELNIGFPWYVLAHDVDGDGRDEIALALDSEIVVWSIGADFQLTMLTTSALDSFEDLMYPVDADSTGPRYALRELQRNLTEGAMGLVVQWLSEEGAVLSEEVRYDEQLFLRSHVHLRDLNADRVADWVFVGGNRASGFGVFVGWSGGKEMETHRLAGDGTEVLFGDLDRDGDRDLVVLDPALGGVHILENLAASQPTAVQTSASGRPVQYRLGDSYPNPFNPAVAIPLDLTADAEQISLVVYNALGRRVRQLWQGPLAAGSQQFVWDGRDEAGRAVAAGVYIYQVAANGRVEAKKMTKLP